MFERPAKTPAINTDAYDLDESETDGYIFWDDSTRRTLGWLYLRWLVKSNMSKWLIGLANLS